MKSVAVVEDDDAVRKALGRLLQAAGFEPMLFQSAEGYLNAAPAPLCVIVDVSLRGMSGLDFQEKLCAAVTPPAIIMITALNDPPIRERAERNGCAAFFLKPVDGNALIETIESLANGAIERTVRRSGS
jgi:two-component system, LuxR family, response regulator TtrR